MAEAEETTQAVVDPDAPVRWNPAKDRVQHHIKTPGGTCSVDGQPIKDAPSSGALGEANPGVHTGYQGLYPSRHENGDPVVRVETGDGGRQNIVHVHPAHLRTLCQAHYLEEWREMYPGQAEPDLDAGIRHIRAKLGI